MPDLPVPKTDWSQHHFPVSLGSQPPTAVEIHLQAWGGLHSQSMVTMVPQTTSRLLGKHGQMNHFSVGQRGKAESLEFGDSGGLTLPIPRQNQ